MWQSGTFLLWFSLLGPVAMAFQQPPVKSCFRDQEISTWCIDLFKDGKTLAVAGGTQRGGEWKIFDLTNGQCLLDGQKNKERAGGAWAVRFSPDRSLLAVGGNRDVVYVIEANTGKVYWDLTDQGHVSPIHGLSFTPDNKYLVSTGGDAMIRVWDIANKKAHAVIRFRSTDGNQPFLFAGYVERAPNVFEVQGCSNSRPNSALAPDGRVIAVAGHADNKVILIDLGSGKIVNTIETKQPKSWALQFTPDGKWLIVGGDSGDLRKPMKSGMIEIWDLEIMKVIASFGTHVWPIKHLAVSPDKKTLISGSVGDGFGVWDVATGKQKFSYFTKSDPRMPIITPNANPATGGPWIQDTTSSAGAAFLPDGKTFLIAPVWSLRQTEIYFHDTATGEPVDYQQRVSGLRKQEEKSR